MSSTFRPTAFVPITISTTTTATKSVPTSGFSTSIKSSPTTVPATNNSSSTKTMPLPFVLIIIAGVLLLVGGVSSFAIWFFTKKQVPKDTSDGDSKNQRPKPLRLKMAGKSPFPFRGNDFDPNSIINVA